MKTSDRLQQLLALPVNQAPAPAVQLVRFLSSKHGLCGEIFCSAYEAYAIVFEQTEGGECDEEPRRFLAAIKPEFDDILAALQQAHWALVRAADHIRSREGHSAAYRDAANARDAARDALVRATRAPHA
jgi:hypothetical protein